MSDSAILLIHCPDQKGIVAAVAGFLYQHGGNILHADQHQDTEQSLFFMRVEWGLAGFDLDKDSFVEHFERLASRFRMQWRVAYSAALPKVAIFVSHYEHCLLDLLYRHSNGELPCRLASIVSNHPGPQKLAQFYGIPFHFVPVTRENREDAEAAQLALLRDYQIDLN